ncbi:transcription factor TFIIIB component B'' homolog [Lampris incognitus]|uniref:transcription factor TFIIIB component B'' homolog n=1 Tax=Lampris incognitus TaxID=2546036 RepID=UPI0024B59039|nr:transcription factor TFIIIB component B'' homolog [Lampris incognitus]
MIRRSRINVRPCVKAPLRTGAPSLPKDSTKPNVETVEGQGDEKDSTAVAAVVANTDQGEPNDQTGEGPVISTAVQRRKRFSFKPRVAPGLTRTSAPATATPVKAVSEPLVQVPVSDIDQPVPSCQSESVVSLGLQSPSRRRPSGESRHPETQPNATPPTLTPSTPQTDPEAENPLELAHFPDEQDKNKECPPVNQTKEVPPKPPDEHSPSLPDKEAIEISERAKTLMSKSTGMGLSKPPHTSLNRLLNDPADVQRLKKARKLRELLKQEICKEKKHKKDKARAKEYVTDPAIMTLRELIYYMPMSNPMTSYIEDSLCANETEVPPVSVKDKTPQRPQEPVINHEMEDLEEEDEMEANDEQAEPMVVPRVKVAEDGSLIIDEESLTVEVKRAKGPNPIEDRDPIFERGSTTTYSSFRKGSYAKPWSDEETDMFFLAVSMVGTDFSMIGQLFPHRTRSEIKNKFKKEERANAWRIDKACRQRSKFDVESFSKLLQKMMEVKNSRTKKLKSPSETTATKRTRRKAKGKKAVRELSDLEEEENGSSDLEEVSGETVNEDICNKEGPPVSKSKRKSRRKPEDQASPEQPEEKKTKTDHITSEQDTQGEASLPEDAEAVLPEDHSTLDSPENSESVKSAKGTMNKPARLSRTKTPKLPLPLGRKLGKKGPRPSIKVKDATPDPLKENTCEEAPKEPVDGNASLVGPTKQKKPDNDNSSESEGETLVTPPKPTREAEEVEEQRHPSSPKESSAFAFVPASLRSPQPVVSEVEETLAELDILTHIPDVLGIPQDALCPDASCEQAQDESGTASCEHHLDLHVDVKDFLSADQMEASEKDSYNEAAQTLLTIGNVTHLSQTSQNQQVTQDHGSELLVQTQVCLSR